MRRIKRGCWLFVTLLIAMPISADEVIDPKLATIDDERSVAWYDARQVGVEGQGWSELQSPYDRLPARAERIVRKPVWDLSKHSAGLCVRFATASSNVLVRWTLTSAKLEMPHMPATGVSGIDLYVRAESGWRWLANGRPAQVSNSAELASGLTPERRSYMLYLPLYNGVQSVEIGIAKGAPLLKLPRAPERSRPIVFWGTSITQGGCASRPGMVHTAILGRRLDCPVVNLGFSGNGKLEPEMAKLIGEIDAAVFVLDCLPNLEAKDVAERAEPSVRILREMQPQAPIVLVEDRTYSDAFLIAAKFQRNQTSRAALRTAFQKLQASGVDRLHYLGGDVQLGDDSEGTVDSSHPTDLGFMRMADAFEKSLAPLLK